MQRPEKTELPARNIRLKNSREKRNSSEKIHQSSTNGKIRQRSLFSSHNTVEHQSSISSSRSTSSSTSASSSTSTSSSRSTSSSTLWQDSDFPSIGRAVFDGSDLTWALTLNVIIFESSLVACRHRVDHEEGVPTIIIFFVILKGDQ